MEVEEECVTVSPISNGPACELSTSFSRESNIVKGGLENMEGKESNPSTSGDMTSKELEDKVTSSFYANKEPSRGPLDGWTKDEKFLLYSGLKLKGSKKVKEIQESIPNKTVEDIETAIAYYKDCANQNPECTTRKLKVRKVKSKPLIPLASWAKLLTDNLSYSELQTETASTLRLIADLEDIPAPISTENIDFRKVYHQLADAMEGKNIQDDRLITEVLSSCVLETALVGKAFIKLSTFKHTINSVNFSEKEMPVFPRPTKDNGLAIVRHFAAQINYNPLSIGEENLTTQQSTKE